MSNTTPVVPEYTQLDAQTQIAVINGRIRDLENQQLQLALRVNAPSPDDNITDQDTRNLATLEDSLSKLRAMTTALTNPTPAAT